MGQVIQLNKENGRKYLSVTKSTSKEGKAGVKPLSKKEVQLS